MNHPIGGTAVLPFVATLRRLLAPAESARPGERCDFCDALLSDAHRHVVDVHTRRLLCACEICAIEGGLVQPKPLGEGGRYRAVAARYLRLPRLAISSAQWDALAIPVDLAFFFFNGTLGRIVACYPGPAGAAESLLPLDAWPALADANPWIKTLVADIEALLVRRVGDEYTCFIVPIDACYELVGRIRRAWTGFGGGDTGQRAIEEFFAAVLDKSAPVSERRPECAHRQAGERT